MSAKLLALGLVAGLMAGTPAPAHGDCASERLHSLRSTVSGTTQRLNGISVHSFSDGTSGTTVHLGSLDFHSFSNGATGTSQRIGGVTFHQFQGPAASSRLLSAGDPDW